MTYSIAFFFQIEDSDQVISCRAILDDLPPTELSTTQLKIDNAVKKITGLKFFLTSCTATTTKRKDAGDFVYGVSIFIVICNTKKVTHQSIYNKIYDEVKLNVRFGKIKTRNTAKLQHTKIIMNQLKQVVKVENEFSFLSFTFAGVFLLFSLII